MNLWHHHDPSPLSPSDLRILPSEDPEPLTTLFRSPLLPSCPWRPPKPLLLEYFCFSSWDPPSAFLPLKPVKPLLLESSYFSSWDPFPPLYLLLLLESPSSPHLPREL